MLKLPNFIIIGAMKSATTSLQDQLIQQAGIYMSDPKEPNFFSNDEEYTKGIDWYSSLFEKFPSNSLRGEASTHYTKLPTYPETISRIKKHLSGVRYIYVMRHPIERLISHYIHEWSMGNYKCGINEAISRYPELIDYSRYAMQLKPYFENFTDENVLPVFFGRLTQHSQLELERVCNFIGYKGKPIWDSNLKAKNISNKRIRKFPLYSLLIESKIAEVIRRNIVPKQIRNMIKSKLRMQERPVINEQNINKLEDIFDQDLATIGQWLGKEINCKNFKDVTTLSALEWNKHDE